MAPAKSTVRRVSNLTLDLKLHSLRTVDPAAKEAAVRVRALVVSGLVSPFEVMDVLRAIAGEVPDPALAEDVVVELVKGRDGLASAMDNDLPAATVHSLITLLRCGVLVDIVGVLAAPQKRTPWWHRLCFSLNSK